MKQKEYVVVIGAGPAGVGAGLALGKRGLVLDSCKEVGGLCRAIKLDGAVFDWGGHSFQTPHPEIRDLVFNSLDMYEQKRDACCYSQGVMIPYPFQANFRQIEDLKVVQKCAAGLSTAVGSKGACNFEEFIVRRFGAGIAGHFMFPYNQKLWGIDLKRLATDWVEERVAAPEGLQEKFLTTGGKRKPLQPETMVAYPARGGFGEIVQALARQLKALNLGKTVLRLDISRRELITKDQQVIRWNRIVSTMPFHKVVFNHNSSPYLRSLPYHGIMAELSYSPGKPLPQLDLETRVVQGLLTMGIIKSSDEVHSTKVIKVPYGYPIPTHERDRIVHRLKGWLERRRIHTVGRFGEWAYINSDEALFRGLALGRALADLE